MLGNWTEHSCEAAHHVECFVECLEGDATLDTGFHPGDLHDFYEIAIDGSQAVHI